MSGCAGKIPDELRSHGMRRVLLKIVRRCCAGVSTSRAAEPKGGVILCGFCLLDGPSYILKIGGISASSRHILRAIEILNLRG